MWILIILLIFSSVFSCYQYQQRKSSEKQRENTSDFLNDTISYYNNKLGQEIATKQSLAGDKNQLDILLSEKIDSLQQLKGLVKKYKKIAAAGNIRTVTEIKEIPVPFDRPIEFDFTRKFKIKEPWYEFTGKVNKYGLNINNFNVKNQMSFVLGVKKNGWFKPNTYSIDVLNSNPFIQITGADSYQFTEDIKRWSIGPSVGYDLLNSQISLGLSLQYGIIRF